MLDATNTFVYHATNAIVDNAFNAIVDNVINAIVNNIAKQNKAMTSNFNFETKTLKYKTNKNCSRESRFLLSNRIQILMHLKFAIDVNR